MEYRPDHFFATFISLYFRATLWIILFSAWKAFYSNCSADIFPWVDFLLGLFINKALPFHLKRMSNKSDKRVFSADLQAHLSGISIKLYNTCSYVPESAIHKS